jgi:DNA mismatch repair protein MutL
MRSTGGRILEVADFPRQRGTTVEVQGLFFNAPARSAFLKSVSAETRACSEVLTTLELANHGVSMVLLSDDRTLMDLPASRDLGERIARLWGEEAADSLVAVDARSSGEAAGGGYSVRGVAQRPDAAQPGVRRGYLFVNGRPFRDTRLQKAVDRGYRTTIPYGARPWYVLYLAVPEGAVDVNVHPAKAEVRFRDEGEVEEMVEGAVRGALGVEESSALFGAATRPGPLTVGEAPQGWFGSTGSGPEPGEGGPGSEGEGTGQMALFVPVGERPGEAAEDAEGQVVRPERTRLWQLHDTYILAETRDGLLIIDQHSAHERVLFHRLMEAYGEGGQSAQRLLFPLTVRLTPEELAQVEEVRGMLHRAGFEVEPFGADTVIVHAVPNPHPYFDAERCFREMVEELTAGTSDLMRAARNQHERIAMTFACKGAIKAGQRLGEGEMQELFDALFATELPHHDVHGRPTIVRLSASELERKFGR